MALDGRSHRWWISVLWRSSHHQPTRTDRCILPRRVSWKTVLYWLKQYYWVPTNMRLRGMIMWICTWNPLQCFLVITCYLWTRRSPDEITVRLGEHDLATFSSTEKNFQVDSIQIHERFLLMNKINDIAVIKLKGTVTFTADIQPICLPQKHIPLNGTTALAAGSSRIFSSRKWS